jgi:phosphatidylserine synthase 2
VSTIVLLAIFLAAEADVFFIKALLWIPADHPLITVRLVFFFLWSLPAVREYYECASQTS